MVVNFSTRSLNGTVLSSNENNNDGMHDYAGWARRFGAIQ